MLAVLKAAASFVPLDPAHPVERLKSLCASVKARVILCGANHVKMLSEVLSTVVTVDETTLAQHEADDGTILPLASNPDAAYVIFTSGSTGTPKVRNPCHDTLWDPD
jgi:non-ribosomal peptide synthetase component F